MPVLLERPEGVIPDTYVSFADDDDFLGAVVVPEPDFGAALARIKAAGLDPGGEALCFSVPPGEHPHMRLLSKADLGGAPSLREMTEEERAIVADNGVAVCRNCLGEVIG